MDARELDRRRKRIGGFRRYGCWAGNQEGVEEDVTKCVFGVWPAVRSSIEQQCQRKRGHGQDGLWCKQHDPAQVEKKEQLHAKRLLDRSAAQDEICRRADELAEQLGVDGKPFWHRAGSWERSGYVERLVISFADAEKLIARLRGGGD